MGTDLLKTELAGVDIGVGRHPRHDGRQRRAAVRAHQRPRDQHRRGRLHLGRRRLRRRTLRGGPSRRPRRQSRPRIWTSTSPTSVPIPVPNLLHRGDAQINEDVTLYTVFAFHASSGQWASLCPFDAATGGATAMAIAEDPAAPSRFIFACTASGVAAKCARGWGFRPWRSAAKLRLRRRGPGLGRTDVRDEAVLRRVQARGARGLLPGPPELHARRHAGRSVRHAPAGLAERDRKSVRRRSRVALDVRAGAVRVRRSAGGPPDAQGVGAAAHALPRAVAGRAVRRAGVRRSPGAGPLRGRALGQPAHEHAAHPGAVTQLLRAQRARGGRGAGVGLQPVHHVGLQDCQPRCCRVDQALVASLGCAVRGAGRRHVRRAARPGVAARSARGRGAAAVEVPARPRRRGRARRTRRRRRGDAGGMGVRPRVAGRRGDGGDPRRRAARAAGKHVAGRRPTPTRRWPRRCRSRSAPPATARAGPPPDTDFRSRRRPAAPVRFSSTRWTPPPPTGRRRRPRCSGTGSSIWTPRRGRHAPRDGHHRVDRGARVGELHVLVGARAEPPVRERPQAGRLVGRLRPDRGQHRPRRGRQVSRPLGSLRACAAPAGFRGPA